jgi:hypothetical protein
VKPVKFIFRKWVKKGVCERAFKQSRVASHGRRQWHQAGVRFAGLGDNHLFSSMGPLAVWRIAVASDVPLVTRNEREFQRVAGLKVVKW